MKRISILTVLLLALAGGSTTAIAGRSTAAAPRMCEKNVVQTAIAAGQFKTLASLLQKAGLAGTLEGKGPFTVFAPTDAAFAKIDPATIEKLKTDSNLLSSILTYHVVPGQASPAQVAGMHKTVQGGAVTVSGMGNNLRVNDAGVVCGGVRTANATVYLIDTVLMPPAA